MSDIRYCEVCFTSSWEPCPPDFPNAVRDGDGWMVCGYCKLQKALVELLAEIPVAELHILIINTKIDLHYGRIFDMDGLRQCMSYVEKWLRKVELNRKAQN